MYSYGTRSVLGPQSTTILAGIICLAVKKAHLKQHVDCESKSKAESRCEAYNSFYDMFFEKRREELCQREPGCAFRGKGITGTCFSKHKYTRFSGAGSRNRDEDASRGPSSAEAETQQLRQHQQQQQKLKFKPETVSPPSDSSSTALTSPSASLSNVRLPQGGVWGVKGEEGKEQELESQIEILMKQQFASSVADQIVNSHQVCPALSCYCLLTALPLLCCTALNFITVLARPLH
jgi:hypothetical protein